MKKMLLMIASIVPLSLIFNGRNFFNILAERSLGEYDESFDLLFIGNAFGFTALRDASLPFMLYTLTVAVVYLFMFGHTMSDNLNVSDIYVFIRENKRTKWFVKNSARIYLQSAVIVLVNVVNDCQNGRCKSAREYRKNSWDNHDNDTVHLDTYYHHKSFLGIVRQYYRIICRSGSTLCLCYICKVRL